MNQAGEKRVYYSSYSYNSYPRHALDGYITLGKLMRREMVIKYQVNVIQEGFAGGIVGDANEAKPPTGLSNIFCKRTAAQDPRGSRTECKATAIVNRTKYC